MKQQWAMQWIVLFPYSHELPQLRLCPSFFIYCQKTFGKNQTTCKKIMVRFYISYSLGRMKKLRGNNFVPIVVSIIFITNIYLKGWRKNWRKIEAQPLFTDIGGHGSQRTFLCWFFKVNRFQFFYRLDTSFCIAYKYFEFTLFSLIKLIPFSYGSITTIFIFFLRILIKAKLRCFLREI